MSIYAKFFGKLKIFAMSNIGSKLATLLLIPMYSHVLPLDEYGEMEIYLTVIMLLMPIITASLYEAVQKFCIDDPSMISDILSSALFPFFMMCFVVGLVVLGAYFVLWESQKLILIFLILISVAVYEFFSKFANGTGREFSFAVSNILVAFVILGSNVYLVYVLEKGIVGILQAQFVAYAVGILYLFVSLRLDQKLFLSKVSPSILRKMLSLSSPLILNAAMWWIFDVSDRWVILYFEGSREVGLYSIACKLAVILLMLHTIFFQTWQISAIENRNHANRSVFYSTIFKMYFLLIVVCTSFLILINKVLLGAALTAEYAEAWRVGNLILLSTAFFCLASFLGVFYVAYSKTTMALLSSILCAILNVALNFMLIPEYGAYGAGLATIASTLCLFLFRLLNTQKLVDYQADKSVICGCSILLLVQVFLADNNFYLPQFMIAVSLTLFFLFKIKNNYDSLVGVLEK
jgi:O-antigen/teichoic acid export membrane protein